MQVNLDKRSSSDLNSRSMKSKSSAQTAVKGSDKYRSSVGPSREQSFLLSLDPREVFTFA